MQEWFIIIWHAFITQSVQAAHDPFFYIAIVVMAASALGLWLERDAPFH